MTDGAPHVLAYVEDPGAANMVLGLRATVGRLGGRLTLTAGGGALAHLAARGEAPQDLDDAQTAVDAAKPDVIAVGTSENPETPAFALIAAARARGLPSVGLIDGPGSAENRWRGRDTDPLTHVPDWLIVPEPSVGAAYEKLGFDGARIVVTGHPGLDRLGTLGDRLAARGRAALRREAFPGLPPDGPLILFLTELSDGLDPADYRRRPDYTLTGRGGSDGRTEIVLEELLDARRARAPEARIALRLHPKTPREIYADYENEIDAWSTGGDPYPALMAADLVTGVTTALLQETAALGATVLSILPRPAERAWLNGADRIPWVANRECLQDGLASALNDPEGFMPLADPAQTTGNAATRVAAALLAIARGKAPR